MDKINLSKPKDQRIHFPRAEIKSIEDMTINQMELYQKMLKNRNLQIISDWKSHLEAFLEYKQPNLVDGYQLIGRQYKASCEGLYVHPCFMKAGKHSYLVYEPAEKYYTMHTTMCDFRAEEPPKRKYPIFILTVCQVLKPYKRKNLQRLFRKENSVFQPWKEDTKETLNAAAQVDLEVIDTQLKYLIKNQKDVSAFTHIT